MAGIEREGVRRARAAEIEYYLIWSVEHGAWWGPSCVGYVPGIAQAGRFPRDVALMLCLKAIPGTAARMGALPELPVPLRDVLAFTSAYLAEFPNRGGVWA